VALMDRVRARIKDKRVLALVQAFLKAGGMTARGGREETLTGTPLSVAFRVQSSRYPACSMSASASGTGWPAARERTGSARGASHR
jgi:hypothetical protein